MAVNAALAVKSPTGATYRERLDKVKTEKELSDIFADFIDMVPLGERLFGSLNPVRTGGPMQVSIAYAEQHADAKRYPYPLPGTIRNEVFTRRGGMYFGIAHLLDYPADYDDMLYRFADFNAGHYASRNAAFQNAVSIMSKTAAGARRRSVAPRRHGERAQQDRTRDSQARDKLDLNDAAIRRDLERGDREDFADTKLYKRVFELADKSGKAVRCRARSCRRSGWKARRSPASSPRSGSRNASTSATRGAAECASGSACHAACAKPASFYLRRSSNRWCSSNAGTSRTSAEF